MKELKRMKKKLLFFFIFWFFSFTQSAFSQTEIITGPYLQLLSSQQVAISWETRVKDQGYLLYQKKKSRGEPVKVVAEEKKLFHRFTLTGLKENTVYYYRIGGSWGEGGKIFFTTPPSPRKTFRFIVYGDTENVEGKNFHSLLVKSFRSVARKISFLVHLGDLSLYLRKNALREDFFTPLRDLIKEKFLFTCPGEKDLDAGDFYSYFPIYIDQPGYSLNFGPAHLIFLDSNEDWSEGSRAYRWLKEDLVNNQHARPWKIVFLHHSFFSGSFKEEDSELRNSLAPLFFQFGVDLVFAGHYHFYERTKPIRAGREDDRFVTIFITSGGGGGKLQRLQKSTFTKISSGSYHYCQITVRKELLTGEVLDLNGRVIDRFSIDKGSRWEQRKRLVSAVTFLNLKKLALIRPQIEFSPLDAYQKVQPLKVKIFTEYPETCQGKILWRSDKENYLLTPWELEFEVKKNHPFEKEFKLEILSPYLYPPPVLQVSVTHQKITSRVEKSPVIRKEVLCQKISGEIKLDGFLDDSLWKKLSPRSDLVVMGGKSSRAQKTAFYLGYNEKNIYIGVDCQETEIEKILYNATRRDEEKIWQDDCIEIFFLLGEKEKRNYYQFIANPTGIQFDSRNGKVNWNGQWQVAGMISERGWSAEFVIPFQTLNLPSPPKGGSWGFNLSRNNMAQRVYTQWSPTYTHSEEVTFLGKLIFE